MLENERPNLIAMAAGAALVQPRHRQSTRPLPDVHAVGIMTIAAAEAAFEERMMLRQVELRVRRQVTLETGVGIAGRIDDPFAGACFRHMPASGTVTRFAAGLAGRIGT